MDSAPREAQSPMSPAPTSVPIEPVSGLLNPGDSADKIDVVTGDEGEEGDDGDSGADLWSQAAEAATASKTPIDIAAF